MTYIHDGNSSLVVVGELAGFSTNASTSIDPPNYSLQSIATLRAQFSHSMFVIECFSPSISSSIQLMIRIAGMPHISAYVSIMIKTSI